jgi:CxxC motif-containing protein (DUF1111 family)
VIVKIDPILSHCKNVATAMNDNDALFSERNCNDIKAATDSCFEATSNFDIVLGAKEASLPLSDKLRIYSAWSFVQPRCEVRGVLLIASRPSFTDIGTGCCPCHRDALPSYVRQPRSDEDRE